MSKQTVLLTITKNHQDGDLPSYSFSFPADPCSGWSERCSGTDFSTVMDAESHGRGYIRSLKHYRRASVEIVYKGF